ncbi:MAG: hypothetical protein QGH11_10800, partial [Pirellulaceae bacterium]|nr:hypothetical protein [Pirellulaceae bacterium]
VAAPQAGDLVVVDFPVVVDLVVAVVLALVGAAVVVDLVAAVVAARNQPGISKHGCVGGV